jgi:hypothetical protein
MQVLLRVDLIDVFAPLAKPIFDNVLVGQGWKKIENEDTWSAMFKNDKTGIIFEVTETDVADAAKIAGIKNYKAVVMYKEIVEND